jgi:hypothetical protein
LQGQRHYLRQPGSDRRRRRGWFIDARAWRWLDVGHDAVESVVGPEQQDSAADLFTDRHAIGFCLTVWYPFQVIEVDSVQVELLIGEASHKHAVRRSGDGSIHRRVWRYRWRSRVRLVAPFNGDDRVVDRRVDDAHIDRRLAGKLPRHRDDGVLGDQAPVRNGTAVIRPLSVPPA